VHDATQPPTVSPLDRLIGAVARGDHSQSVEAYKACCEIGQPLVSQVVEKIRSVNWKVLGSSEKLLYFTCLTRLLHDIDESASRDLCDAILSEGCHPVFATRLRSVQAFSLEDFEAKTLGPLPCHVATTISRRDDVWRYLTSWLGHMPSEDLAGVHRLYVIDKARLPRALGTYLRSFSVISLAWLPSQAWNPFAVLQTEFTLYHEVGHHGDKRESAAKESSEAFADTYAMRIFRKAHPRIGKGWVRIFIMPSYIIKKIHRARQRRDLKESSS
jgi:hypothetical protein